MGISKIIKGWHLLYVGANGKPTYGLEATSLEPDKSVNSGLQITWKINDYTFTNYPVSMMDSYGLTEEKYQELLAELRTLTKA